MAAIRHTALNGGMVEIDGGGADLTRPFASFIVARFGSHLQEFGAGRLDFGATVARELEIDLTEEYSYQGGRLRLGSGPWVDLDTKHETVIRIAVWEGTAYSLKTVKYGGRSLDLIALLDQFVISETADGIAMRPTNPHEVRLARIGGHAPSVVQNVPGVGLLEVAELTPERAKRLPPWAGLPVTGGELFVENERSRDAKTFLMVGHTAVSRLYPNHWEDEEAAIVDRFSKMKVEWRS